MGNAVAAALQDVGLSVSADEVEQRIADAIRELARRPVTADPRAEFTPEEAAVLAEGGFDLSPRRADEPDPTLRAAEQYAALLATALTVSEAARRLGVDSSRIRQRLLAHQLYGVRLSHRWLLPAFQFAENNIV